MIGPIELCQPSVCLAAAWKYLEAKLLDYLQAVLKGLKQIGLQNIFLPLLMSIALYL